MTSPDKPREFWLNERLERIYKDSDASCPDDEIHVIEKSAYDSLAAQLAEAEMQSKVNWQKWNDNHCDEVLEENEKLKSLLAKAEAALKFYENARRLMIEVRDLPVNFASMDIADNGDRARQTIKEIREAMK